MIDWDYGPGVFSLWIAVATIGPILYGTFVIDAYWEKHQAEDDDGPNVFS